MNQTVRNLPGISVPSGTVVETAARRVEAIEASVRAALRTCGRHSIADLDCDCFISADDHVTVTLRGRLPSFYLNQLAQELVRRVPGVHQVHNRIQVDFCGSGFQPT